MPTVLRTAGFSFYFFSDDHPPAHVHVSSGDGVAVVELETGRVRHSVGGIREKDVRRAVALVAEHRDELQRAWDAFAARREGRRDG